MIRIDLGKEIAFIEIGGTPTLSEIQESIGELLDHPDHKAKMDEIWDFRSASMSSFGREELQGLAACVKVHLAQLGERVAHVIAKDVDYGIGRMWTTYASIYGANQHRTVVYSIEDALRWLEKDGTSASASR